MKNEKQQIRTSLREFWVESGSSSIPVRVMCINRNPLFRDGETLESFCQRILAAGLNPNRMFVVPDYELKSVFRGVGKISGFLFALTR